MSEFPWEVIVGEGAVGAQPVQKYWVNIEEQDYIRRVTLAIAALGKFDLGKGDGLVSVFTETFGFDRRYLEFAIRQVGGSETFLAEILGGPTGVWPVMLEMADGFPGTFAELRDYAKSTMEASK